ncbi:sigma-70 family RNA polymerase sigma factor [Gorillibacterium sp. sgz500922]|uniref:sigma-70 family RNA polymerase sigma factor n=1 Tax=Gorillibacterium sp. sgz500922 TaxID=3446694 RepID=UPI003F66A5A7
MDVTQAVKRAKKGDKEALLQLVLAEKEAYYRLAYAYLRNEEEAMDALEDMIVKLFEQIGRLRKEEAFYSWSKTILVNRCKRTLRTGKRLLPLRDEPAEGTDQWVDGRAEARTTEERIDLETLLVRLNEDQHEAIRLKYYHDLDYRTIAEITRVSPGTVKSRIFHGLRKLRELYGRDGDGE